MGPQTTDLPDVGENREIMQKPVTKEESPSLAVVNVVAERRGCNAAELDPLYEVIDPDLLDAFLTREESRESNVQISFEYEGVQIEIKQTDQCTYIVTDD